MDQNRIRTIKLLRSRRPQYCNTNCQEEKYVNANCQEEEEEEWRMRPALCFTFPVSHLRLRLHTSVLLTSPVSFPTILSCCTGMTHWRLGHLDTRQAVNLFSTTKRRKKDMFEIASRRPVFCSTSLISRCLPCSPVLLTSQARPTILYWHDSIWCRFRLRLQN